MRSRIGEAERLSVAQLHEATYLGTMRSLQALADVVLAGFAQLNVLQGDYQVAMNQMMASFELAFTAAMYDTIEEGGDAEDPQETPEG